LREPNTSGNGDRSYICLCVTRKKTVKEKKKKKKVEMFAAKIFLGMQPCSNLKAIQKVGDAGGKKKNKLNSNVVE